MSWSFLTSRPRRAKFAIDAIEEGMRLGICAKVILGRYGCLRVRKNRLEQGELRRERSNEEKL